MSCKGCEKRSLGCHSTCEDYKAFKEKKQQEYEASHDKADYELGRYQQQCYEKWLRRNPRKRNGWRNC